MFAQKWLLTARARLALSSVNDLRSHSSPEGHRFKSIPATNFQQKSAHWPPPCSPTICRRDEVSLDEVERILIPPFPGSNPGPSQPVRSPRCDFQVWENRRQARGLAGNGRNGKTCAIEGSLPVQFEPTCVGRVALPYRDYAIRRSRYHSLGAGSAKSGRPISGCGLMRAQFGAVERRYHSIVPRLVQSQTACRKRSTSGQYRDLAILGSCLKRRQR